MGEVIDIVAAPLVILGALAISGVAYWIATRNIRAAKYPYGRKRRRSKKRDGK